MFHIPSGIHREPTLRVEQGLGDESKTIAEKKNVLLQSNRIVRGL